MTTGSKNKLFYWFNIIFLMINTAFFVFLWPNMNSTPPPENKSQELNLEFLKEELALTDQQYAQLLEMDRQVLKRHQTVLKLLCQNRYRLLNELAKPKPSMEELHNTARSVGFLHRALKKQTIYHLLNVKKICTPEQTKKLNKIFIEILEIDKHCVECATPCSKNEKKEKCKRCLQVYPYDNQAEDRLRQQEKDSLL